MSPGERAAAEEEVYWQAGHRATMRERRLFATLDAARAERDELQRQLDEIENQDIPGEDN